MMGWGVKKASLRGAGQRDKGKPAKETVGKGDSKA